MSPQAASPAPGSPAPVPGAAVDAVVADGAPPTIRLAYDGAAPPRALIDALRADGWGPLPAVPPPASAIDWDTPDPTRPGGYAIRSFDAVSRGEWIGPPDGREAAVDRARLLVAQAGGPPAAGVAGAPHRETPDLAYRGVRAAPAPTSPAPPGGVVIEVVADPSAVALVRQRLARDGAILDERVEEKVTTTTYRGARSEQRVQRVHLRAAVEGAAAAALRADLAVPGVHRVAVVP